MSLFKEAALEVYNLDHSIAMIAMKNGLQQCPFLFFLKKRPLVDFSEILVRVEKYACAEEGYGTHVPSITLSTLMIHSVHVPSVVLIALAPAPLSTSSSIPTPTEWPLDQEF